MNWFDRIRGRQEPEPAPADEPSADPVDDLETRASDYTAQELRRRDARVMDPPGDVNKTAAAAFAALVYSRAMATAIVEPDDMAEVITPRILAMIGRQLILKGNSVFSIDVAGGDLRLLPASDFTVFGRPNPRTWRYLVHLPGPTQPEVIRFAQAGIVHCRINEPALRPWMGQSPLELAGLTADTLANLETRLSQEANARTGYLLPVPAMDAEPLAALKGDLKTMRGETGLVETTASGFDRGPERAPRGDWEPKRVGAQIPASNAALRGSVALEVLAAAGVPVALFAPSDGGSAREAYRQLLTNHIQPVGLLVAAELSDKLDADVRFKWSRLAAADIAARARALGSLIQAGVEVDEAVELAGLSE